MTGATPASGVRPTVNSAAGCFHCGLPLDATAFPVVLDGARRDTCCRGCQAVVQTIVDNGLAAYYRNRTAPAPVARDRDPVLAELDLYDLPEIQRNFVRDINAASHEKEALLLIDGATCAACIWLIEQRLARLPGVLSATLNYATRRARVRWDNRKTALSSILFAVASLGYAAQPYDSNRAEARFQRERRVLLWRLFIAGFSMMQVMMYAIPVYIADGAMTPHIEQLMRVASLILTLPVVLWSAAPFYAGALRDLQARRAGMDVPVSMGIVIAFAASLWAAWIGSGQVYFDSISMFVFLLLGARFLETSAYAKAIEAQEQLVRMVPATAERLVEYPGNVGERVAAVVLCPGNFVRVRPGAAIPADGVVVDGESAVDEGLLTGESRPVNKRVGDALTGGAVNLDGILTMRVIRVGEDTVLSGITRLMDRAQTTKPRIAQVADRVAQGFVATLLLLTAVAFSVWWQIDSTRALWVAVSMLVVTCPCALSLATPAALAAATGAAHRAGVLITRGTALETLARATHFVFDKTGTLTTGRMTLVGVRLLGNTTRERCLACAAALESSSEHPAGRALAAAVPGVYPVAASVRNVAGQGVEGLIGGRLMRIGRPEFVAELNHQPLPGGLDDEASGAVVTIAFGDEQGWLALFMLDDTLRHDARDVVQTLSGDGAVVIMLSGDHHARAVRTARELGIEVASGGASPKGKLAQVREFQRQGAIVAMVGDGINDVPVLAQAQVSITLRSGTDLAQSTADIVLMADQLGALVVARRYAKRTLRIIHQNLVWAVLYNAVALPLAMVGLITPVVAAAGMSASSLIVVLNALRLTRSER